MLMAEAKAPYNPQSVKDVWDNHHAAGVARDLQMALADYTVDSWIKVYNNNTQKLIVVKGLAQIGAFFAHTFD
jgi:hypothetical protein